MFTRHRIAAALSFTALLAAVIAAARSLPPERIQRVAPVDSQTVRRAQVQDTSQYSLLVKGLLASRTFAVQFRTVPLRIEVRNLIVGNAQTEAIPTPTHIIMELRGGTVIAVVDGKKSEHYPGDFWVVEKGSRLTLENTKDVAVIRALYLFEGR